MSRSRTSVSLWLAIPLLAASGCLTADPSKSDGSAGGSTDMATTIGCVDPESCNEVDAAVDPGADLSTTGPGSTADMAGPAGDMADPAPDMPGPLPTPAAPIPPLPAGAVALYFSDCQTGAAAGCVPGDDANPGTEASPKRDYHSVQFNTLPAGSQLRFKRGGSWNHPLTRLENANATPAAPLVFADYGTGPAPIFRATGILCIEFGGLNNTNNDGGYTFLNLKLDGLGTSDWGFWLRDNLRNVVIDNVEITGFKIAIHSQQRAPHYITGFVLRNSKIHLNSDMGILGSFNGALIEHNLFERNNFSGSGFSHAIYNSGGTNNVIRSNHFLKNSVVNNVCTGGNVTIHGQNTGLLLENNVIEQDAATGGCYGFSITPGYNTAEWFRQTVVRGNTVINVGNCSVCAGAAPGILVENNLAINTMAGAWHSAVYIPANVDNPGETGDDADGNAIVRNNVMCQATPHANSAVTTFTAAAAVGATITNNVLRTGADATTGPCVR